MLSSKRATNSCALSIESKDLVGSALIKFSYVLKGCRDSQFANDASLVFDKPKGKSAIRTGDIRTGGY
jgi:hypothetical protein